MPVAAAVIGGVATIGGSLLASSSARSAANQASAAQTAANDRAIAEQRRQYDQTRTDLQPWTTAGQQALGQQGNLLGLNGTPQQQAAIDQLKASPLYESLFGNGRDAILANASATGGLRGGNTNAALANFGRDTLASVIQQQVANLGSVSGQGQDAAAKVGDAGGEASRVISTLFNNTGAAQAGSVLAGAGATIGTIRDITGTIGGLAHNRDVQNWIGKLF